MADAERDRLELTGRIETLEMAKRELEAENATKIEENRNLLDQLEMLNTTVSDSDVMIKSLEASLLSSQQAVRRLESSAARAADAERHLAALEEEADRLHDDLRLSKEDSRTQLQRFKEAQRGIMDMQDQLERIESEAREERERHTEVVDRMERQRDIEKQLDTAAGRLKGAAATKGMQGTKGSNQIVGHFVRDLLQDNANLQLGIAELREMLLNSNDEIQSLREQLVYHAPLPDKADGLDAFEVNRERESTPISLDADLGLRGQDHTPKLSQELHIHHHYHAVTKREPRRPKKKRLHTIHNSDSSSHFAPPLSLPSSPSAGGQWRLTRSPTAPALLSHNTQNAKPTLSMPGAVQSWANYSSTPSEFASMPSSPRSNNRTSSIFDRGFMDHDLPSPTTSFDPLSPTWRASTHSKRASEASFLSLSGLSQLDLHDGPSVPTTNHHTYGHKHADDTIHEEDEDAHHDLPRSPPLLAHLKPPVPSLDESSMQDSTETSSTDDWSKYQEEYHDEFVSSRPILHRAVSHESIMSLTGGLDIHTLKSRPSQMTLRPIGGAEAVVTVTGVTAQPTLSRGSAKRSDVALRDHFMGRSTTRAVSSPLRTSSRSPASSATSGGTITGNTAGGIGRWVGWRPWAGGNSNDGASRSSNHRSISGTRAPMGEASADEARSKGLAIVGSQYDKRPTGINQAGSIPGFQAYWAATKRKGAPARVTSETVDQDALMEGLRDGM